VAGCHHTELRAHTRFSAAVTASTNTGLAVAVLNLGSGRELNLGSGSELNLGSGSELNLGSGVELNLGSALKED